MAQPEKPAPKPAATPPRAASDEHREDQLPAALASLRDVLCKGILLTGKRLRETIDETVEHGRMTRQDAQELGGNLVEIGRRQTQDALRSADRMRRAAGKSVLAVIEKRLP